MLGYKTTSVEKANKCKKKNQRDLLGNMTLDRIEWWKNSCGRVYLVSNEIFNICHVKRILSKLQLRLSWVVCFNCVSKICFCLNAISVSKISFAMSVV